MLGSLQKDTGIQGAMWHSGLSKEEILKRTVNGVFEYDDECNCCNHGGDSEECSAMTFHIFDKNLDIIFDQDFEQ